MEKNELTLEMLKASFNKIPHSNRTVGLWNLRREEMKKVYPQTLISELDSSGFIIKWLDGHN